MNALALPSLQVRHRHLAFVVLFCAVLLNAATVLGYDPDRHYEAYRLHPGYEAADVTIKPRPAYMDTSDRAAKAIIDDLVKTICAMRLQGGVKTVGQTEVPQPTSVVDEIKYLTERMVDAPEKFLGVAATDQEVNESLSYLLFHSEQPALTGMQNPFVKFTKEPVIDVEGIPFPVSRELALAFKVNQTKDNSLEPKDVMKMALEVSGGDYSAATLLAHNFLKEITYSGRSKFESTFATVAGFPRADADAAAANARLRKEYESAFRKSDFTVWPRENGVLTIGMTAGAPVLAAKLKNLRVAGDPHIGDKMGPWYHVFGVLFLSTSAKGGRLTAEAWAKVEGLARRLPIFSSPYDYFKELLSNLAGEQSGAILDCLKQEPAGPPSGYLSCATQLRGKYREHVVDFGGNEINNSYSGVFLSHQSLEVIPIQMNGQRFFGQRKGRLKGNSIIMRGTTYEYSYSVEGRFNADRSAILEVTVLQSTVVTQGDYQVERIRQSFTCTNVPRTTRGQKGEGAVYRSDNPTVVRCEQTMTQTTTAPDGKIMTRSHDNFEFIGGNYVSFELGAKAWDIGLAGMGLAPSP